MTAVEHVGPCPRCQGRDRFSVNTARGVFNCRGCGVGGDGIALVRHVYDCGYREALNFLGQERPRAPCEAPYTEWRGPTVQFGSFAEPASANPPELDAKSSADAVALFRQSVGPCGTPAAAYYKSRRLEIADLAGRAIRWNPRIGALVALFRNIHTGRTASRLPNLPRHRRSKDRAQIPWPGRRRRHHARSIRQRVAGAACRRGD